MFQNNILYLPIIIEIKLVNNRNVSKNGTMVSLTFH